MVYYIPNVVTIIPTMIPILIEQQAIDGITFNSNIILHINPKNTTIPAMMIEHAVLI